MLKRETLIVSILVLMVACGGPPKPVASNTGATSSGGTVYDEPAETTREPDIADEQIVSDDSIYEEQLDTLNPDDPQEQPMSELNWDPVYFAFDKASLTEEGRANLSSYARILRDNPSYEVLLEGHCDERGTEDYNLALGERRAQTVMQYMLQLGVDRRSMKTISYGELRPSELGSNEQAWQMNRRVSFTFPASANN